MKIGLRRNSSLLNALRSKHEDSIKLIFEIPIVFSNIHKGAKHIFINHTRLPYFLSIHESDMIALREAGLILSEASVKIPKLRINYHELAQQYRQQLANGTFSTRAELARSIGVSRAWITKVLNRNPAKM